jgi:hypothetical protein
MYDKYTHTHIQDNEKSGDYKPTLNFTLPHTIYITLHLHNSNVHQFTPHNLIFDKSVQTARQNSGNASQKKSTHNVG